MFNQVVLSSHPMSVPFIHNQSKELDEEETRTERLLEILTELVPKTGGHQ